MTLILLLSRFKILGPDGSDYLSGQEAILGGSDTDDAWLAIQYEIDLTVFNCTFYAPMSWVESEIRVHNFRLFIVIDQFCR